MGSSREAVGSRSKRASEDASAAPAREARGDDAGAWDVVVVGAGVAGASLAHSFGKQGRRVLCVERDLSEPDRIVGSCYSPVGT